MTKFLAVETNDLHKSYRSFRKKPVSALQGVSLQVEAGTIFGLIGQNGAGKTSLVKILVGLSEQTGGFVRVLGGSPRAGGIRGQMGYLPEQMRLPNVLAERFLRHMGALNRIDSKTLNRRIPELLDQVGLAGIDRPIQTAKTLEVKRWLPGSSELCKSGTRNYLQLVLEFMKLDGNSDAKKEGK